MTDDTLIAYGGAVKALGDGKIGGYLVAFTGPDRPDLTGEYFTKDTDFDIEDGDKATVYYNHGEDPTLGYRKFGRATIKIDDVGVWAEMQMKIRDEYERMIYSMAEAGKLGWSSGSLPHLVELVPTEGAKWIKRWPIGKDASLTPTPAAGLVLTAIQPLKTWAANMQALEVVHEGAGNAPETTAKAQAQPEPTSLTNEDTMSTEQQTVAPDPRIDQLMTAVEGLAGTVKTLIEGQTKSAGFQVVADEADRALAGNPFKSLGEQLTAVKRYAQGYEDVRLRALKATGANEGVGSDGGFLLQPTFTDSILMPMHETGPFSARVRRLPVGANSNSGVLYGVDETSRATGSRWGGVQGYRVAEGGTLTASRPTFKQINWRLKKFAVLVYATDELLADAPQLQSVIQQGASEELSFMVNDDIVNGLGASGPLGFLNSNSLVSVAKETGQAAATIVYQNIVKMWARLHSRSKANAAWFINTDVTPQLAAMSLAVGTGGVPVYMPAGGLSASPYGSLYGRPVIESEFNATLGTVGDIILADMSEYLFWEKGGTESASSIHVQFLTDETVFRFIYRCEGQPAWQTTLTPYKGGSNTVSPFVALATRA